MFRPVISVVVPCYNAEKYIQQTLQSIYDQTYEGMIETVVIDDLSSDDSVNMIRGFIAGHSIVQESDQQESPVRIFRLICNESNKGVAKTRNIGVKECSGQYICYMDSDDLWDTSKVQKQVDVLAGYMEDKSDQTSDSLLSYPDIAPVLLCTGRQYIDVDGRSTGKSISVPEVITYEAMLKTNLIPCSSVMVRRDVALKFPMERDDLVEDYINWMKIIRATGPAAGVNEPLLKYRVLPGSRSRNKLRAARKHFQAQRYLGISGPAACVNLVSYMINGLRKI